MSKAEEQASKWYNSVKYKSDLSGTPISGYIAGYEQAMAEIEEKITQVKKNGTWDGVDVDEFMKQVRGE